MKPSKQLLEKALRELPIDEIEERLHAYSQNSHLNSPSEKTWLKVRHWIDKYHIVLLELETPKPSERMSE